MPKRVISRIDANLHLSQLDPQARSMLVRAALSAHMREIGKRVDNQREDKRAIIAAAQRKRWAAFRAARLAEQHAYNASKGLPLDTPLPPKPKLARKRVYTRAELLDIIEAEMKKAFPRGMTPENEKEFLAWKPKDKRLEGYNV